MPLLVVLVATTVVASISRLPLTLVAPMPVSAFSVTLAPVTSTVASEFRSVIFAVRAVTVAFAPSVLRPLTATWPPTTITLVSKFAVPTVVIPVPSAARPMVTRLKPEPMASTAVLSSLNVPLPPVMLISMAAAAVCGRSTRSPDALEVTELAPPLNVTVSTVKVEALAPVPEPMTTVDPNLASLAFVILNVCSACVPPIAPSNSTSDVPVLIVN